MPTSVLINPSGVEGNISSCKTEITYLNGTSRNSLWVEGNTGYATNNCTGQVDKFESWGFTGFADGVFIFISVVVVVAAWRLLFSDTY